MNVVPITPTEPNCFGTCCPVHARCARYLSVDGMRHGFVIATCTTDGDDRPLFLALEPSP
jgi:hypothetical protein